MEYGAKQSHTGDSKAIHGIPRWARNPNLNAHKLIRAYLLCEEGKGYAMLELMRGLCSDPVGHPDTYVRLFNKWMLDLREEMGHASGHVFDLDNQGRVTVFPPIAEVFNAYRGQFLHH